MTILPWERGRLTGEKEVSDNFLVLFPTVFPLLSWFEIQTQLSI